MKDVQHRLWQILLDGQLLTVPHSSASSLLDLGCGTAVWTSTVAQKFPDINVVGVDLTPPSNNFGIKNLAFLKADIEEPWYFADNPGCRYDIITLRVLVSAIRDWPKLIRRCFEHLKPGGWIEIPDVTIGVFSDQLDWQDESSAIMRWYQCYRRGASMSGIDGFANRKRTDCLASADFTHISEKFFTCYLDEHSAAEPRDKEIARLTKQNMLGLLDAVTKTMVARNQWEVLQITGAELEQLKQEAITEIEWQSAQRKFHWI